MPAGVPDQHGVLVVDKPTGPTSFDIVAGTRRLYATRRVGHAGTLDPMASGVLVILVGEATKLSGVLTAAHKTYRATIQFGTTTSTLDALGEIVEQSPIDPGALTDQLLRRALEAESLRTAQVPPQVSAIKVAGKRAYALARQGRAVELPAREVHVSHLELTARTSCSVSVELSVSKGYYVRSLARDVGERLGLPAHLSELRRTESGAFTLAMAQAWPLTSRTTLLPLETAVRTCLPSATLTDVGVVRARHGKLLGPDDFERAPAAHDVHAWFDGAARLVALGTGCESGFRVQRGINGGTDRPRSGTLSDD